MLESPNSPPDHMGRPVVARRARKNPRPRAIAFPDERRSFCRTCRKAHPACPRRFYAQGGGREQWGSSAIEHRIVRRSFGQSALLGGGGGAGERALPRAGKLRYLVQGMPIWWHFTITQVPTR